MHVSSMLSTHSEKFLSPTSSAKKTPMLTPSPMPRWTAVHEYPPCGCEIECGCMKKEKESPFPKFQGCTFVLQDQEFHPPPNTLVGPNAIVSWEMLMEPYLEFKIGVGVIIFLFIGIFALVGAALALVKQLITIARKGDRYFYIN